MVARVLAPRGMVGACAIALALGVPGCGSGAGSRRAASPSATAPTTTTQPPSARPPRLVLRASVTGWHLPAPVYRTVGVALGDRIFVLGGHDTEEGTISDVYVLDTSSGRSRVAGSLALPTHGSAAAVLNARVLVFGGASTSVHDTVQQFDPARGATRVIAHLPTVRADVTAAVVGGTVVLVGGFDGAEPHSEVWASANGRSFHLLAKLPQAIRYSAVVADGDNIYVFGGLISGGEYNGTFSTLVQRVSVSGHSARVVGRLPAPLAHAMGALLGGRVLVLGGSTPTGPSGAILGFDPASGRISRAGHLPYPLTDGAVTTIGNDVYLLGGISSRPLAGVIDVRLTPAG